jgi:DNA-directed RNA polymerase specialized sigma subunit
MSIVNTESQILLQSLRDKLDESEYKVCEVLLNENHKLTKTEVSQQLGMTVSAISNIYKRLQKRFAQNKVFQTNY